MLDVLLKKWDEILLLMKEENDITDIAFKTWVQYFKPYSVRDHMITVCIEKDNLVLDVNYFEKKYRTPLIMTITEVMEEEFNVRFILPDTIKEIQNENTENQQVSSIINETNLNPRYTFDSFVVGKNNELAHATALAVAEDPGIYGNPLFIYGGVGLGKTHLMHSIASYVLERDPSAKIIYVTSEEFTNELVHSIQTKQVEEFKNKYRNIDMLLIDDIQFIVGKVGTQEEFFHTFNTLYENKKQIVISSDKPPKDIDGLEERLISRFKVGLTVDVQPPDYETRMAILMKHADIDHMEISQECCHYIADHIHSNIRELEGALKQIFNWSRLKKRPVDLPLVEEALKNIISPEESKPITVEAIIDVVAEHYNISSSDIIGPKRSKDIALPRQVCMYICRMETNISLESIGQSLGNRDHTTIMHGTEKIEKARKSDKELDNSIEIIKKKLNIAK